MEKASNNVESRIGRDLYARILLLSLKKPRFLVSELVRLMPTLRAPHLQRALANLGKRGLLSISRAGIEVNDRLGIAEILMREGFSPDTISELLSWREFEQFCRQDLEENGFEVRTNVRFTHDITRHEIDIVAAKWPYLLFIDCKHWRPGKAAAFKGAALKQVRRMEAALKMESVLGMNASISLRKFQRLALIVSLTDTPTRMVDGIPLVPIFRLNDFLLRLDRYWDEVTIRKARNEDLENWLSL